jgi:hypothetical protein
MILSQCDLEESLLPFLIHRSEVCNRLHSRLRHLNASDAQLSR